MIGEKTSGSRLSPVMSSGSSTGSIVNNNDSRNENRMNEAPTKQSTGTVAHEDESDSSTLTRKSSKSNASSKSEKGRAKSYKSRSRSKSPHSKASTSTSSTIKSFKSDHSSSSANASQEGKDVLKVKEKDSVPDVGNRNEQSNDASSVDNSERIETNGDNPPENERNGEISELKTPREWTKLERRRDNHPQKSTANVHGQIWEQYLEELKGQDEKENEIDDISNGENDERLLGTILSQKSAGGQTRRPTSSRKAKK